MVSARGPPRGHLMVEWLINAPADCGQEVHRIDSGRGLRRRDLPRTRKTQLKEPKKTTETYGIDSREDHSVFIWPSGYYVPPSS